MHTRDEVTRRDAFAAFVAEHEPALKRAICAAAGIERGIDALQDALAYAWQNWDRISVMDNPPGYVYRVARSRVRTSRTVPVSFPPVTEHGAPWIEPGLPDALAALSVNQRTVVWLVLGFEWTLQEVADLLGMSIRSVRTHLDRGQRKLRRHLGADA